MSRAAEEDDIMGDIYDDDDDDETFELHELVFAQSIGVDLEEDFAAELVDLAVKALYTLPDGWEVDFAESDMGKIPFFFDTNSGESHWTHPFVDDCRIIVAEKRQDLYEEYEEEGDDEDEENGADYDEGVIEGEGEIDSKQPAADDRSVMTGFVSVDTSIAPVITNVEEPAAISRIDSMAELKQTIAPPAPVEAPSVPLKDDDFLKLDDGSVVADDNQVTSSMPSPQKKSLDTDSVVSNNNNNNVDSNLEEPSNITFDSSIAPSVEPVPELITSDLPESDQIQTEVSPLGHVEQEESKPLQINTPERSPKPAGVESSWTPPSRKQSFLSQDVPQLEEVTREGKKSLDTDTVVTEAAAPQEAEETSVQPAPEEEQDEEVSSLVQQQHEDVVQHTPPKPHQQEMEVTDMDDDPATESLAESSSPPPAEDSIGPASQSENVDSFSNRTSPRANSNNNYTDSQKIENFATKSKVVFDDPFADFFKVESTLLDMYKDSSDERSIDNPNYFQLNQSMDIDKLLAAKNRAEDEIAAKKELERRRELARQEALRKEEERKQKLQQKETARLLMQQQQQQQQAQEEAKKKAAADEAASQQSSAVRRNNNLDDDVSIGSSLTNATNFLSVDGSQYARSIDSRNHMDLFSTTIDEGKLPGETDEMVTGNLTKSLNIFDDERFQNTKPVVPLDKSVDIKDHFLSMFRSEANSRENESSNMDGLNGTGRISPSRMKLFTAKPRTLAKLNNNTAGNAGSTVTVKLRKKKSPKKGSKNNGNTPSSSSNSSKWFVLEAYSSYKEADLAIRLFERMHPTTSQVNQAFPIVAKTLPPLDHAMSQRYQTGNDNMGMSAFNQTHDDMLTAPSSSNLLRDGVDKRTINMTIGKELPKLRIARDLSRMQWLVECNDPNAKKVFQTRIGKRLPMPLLRGNSMAGSSSSSLMDTSSTFEEGGLGGTSSKGVDGIAFTASFNPQSMMSSSNSKHVSSALSVVYSGPDIASQNNRSMARKINSTGRFSMLPQPSTQPVHIAGLPPGISPEIVSKFPSLVDRPTQPKSFRTILQHPSSPTE